jgi:hypothetical protein
MNPLEEIIKLFKQFDELTAASNILQTLLKYARTIEQYDDLARLFHEVKDYQNAIKTAETVLSLSATPQQLYSARANLAKLYNHTNSPDKALMYINANLHINPNDYEALMEKVFSLYLKSDYAASKELTEQLLNDPTLPDNVKDRCKFNYGSHLLEQGQFQEGLEGFINTGHKIGIWPKVQFPGPEWDGSVTLNKNIAILAEGGIGDEILSIRFMTKIKELGMIPHFITNRKEMVSLLNRNGFNTVASRFDVPQDSEWCLAMMLPILLKSEPDDLWHGPFLTPDPQYVEKWKKIFQDNNLTGKRLIALRFSGNNFYDQDLHRKLSPELFDQYFDLNRDDIQFISLQLEDNEDIMNYPKVFDAKPYLESLEDLLACLSLVDHTISSCTSIVHIAASADFKVTVLPPIAKYYCWLTRDPQNDKRSLWYSDKCTVLYQKAWKDYSHLADVII